VRHRAGRGAVVGAVEAERGGEGATEPGSPDEAGAEVAERIRKRAVRGCCGRAAGGAGGRGRGGRAGGGGRGGRAGETAGHAGPAGETGSICSVRLVLEWVPPFWGWMRDPLCRGNG
jgi:hypothetical protein